MDYVEELDQANAANYQKIKESLKKDIQERTDEAVAQAPPVVKSAVQEASEELQDKMEDFSRTETENVPSPPTWVTFAAENKSAIEKALSDLSLLVGRDVKNAEENIKNEMMKIFDATEKAIGVIHSGIEFLSSEKEKLILKEKKISETLASRR